MGTEIPDQASELGEVLGRAGPCSIGIMRLQNDVQPGKRRDAGRLTERLGNKLRGIHRTCRVGIVAAEAAQRKTKRGQVLGVALDAEHGESRRLPSFSRRPAARSCTPCTVLDPPQTWGVRCLVARRNRFVRTDVSTRRIPDRSIVVQTVSGPNPGHGAPTVRQAREARIAATAGAAMPDHDGSLRAQLEPLIRAAGIRKTAHHLGIHHSTLIAWMRGSRRMSSEAIDRLVKYLGLVVRIERCPNSHRGPSQET
jgi:hypothetical protein